MIVDKKLKNFQTIFCLQVISISVLMGVFKYYIDLYAFHYAFATVLVAVLIALVFEFKVMKDVKPLLPMMISIHDTVKKYTGQIIVLSVLYFVFFVASTIIDGITGAVLMAVAVVFLLFSSFIAVKRKYLKNKPEGL